MFSVLAAGNIGRNVWDDYKKKNRFKILDLYNTF